MNIEAKQTVAVVGAGIVGVSTAVWLRRKGIDVILIDRDRPGSTNSASYGNAGVLAACSVAPVTAPGLIWKSPNMVFGPNFPLFLRWSYLPRLTPWLLKYLSNANDADTRRIAAGLGPLTSDSVEQHEALAKGTAAEAWVQRSDYGFAYKSRAAFDADAYTWALRHDAGFAPELICGASVRELEPTLSSDFDCVALLRDHGYVHNPAGYVTALFDEAVRLGATFRQAEVRDFDLSDGRITVVQTTQGILHCDKAVLTSGIWSGDLARKLGLKVPMETERGYHITFKSPDVLSRIPLMITTGKFVATPMQDDLRCAGVVEFGGLSASASRKPLELLHRKVRECFPDMTWQSEETWFGHRPAPSDSLPLIGEIGQTGVIAGFGHHHIGLTAGPKTGRIIAGLVSEQPGNMDLTDYAPGRF
ncbi:MAG: FAD-dependent oxidoreductase [Pseudomonadota bacterium]